MRMRRGDAASNISMENGEKLRRQRAASTSFGVGVR